MIFDRRKTSDYMYIIHLLVLVNSERQEGHRRHPDLTCVVSYHRTQT